MDIQFRITSWNIQGLHKYEDCNDIKTFLLQFDIIHLCETWTKYSGEFDSFLNKYVPFVRVRYFNSNLWRYSGEVSIFIKNDLFEKVKITRVCEHINECVVLLFSLAKLSCFKDIVMYVSYISPEGSTIYTGYDQQNGIIRMKVNVENLNYFIQILCYFCQVILMLELKIE